MGLVHTEKVQYKDRSVLVKMGWYRSRMKVMMGELFVHIEGYYMFIHDEDDEFESHYNCIYDDTLPPGPRFTQDLEHFKKKLKELGIQVSDAFLTKVVLQH